MYLSALQLAAPDHQILVGLLTPDCDSEQLIEIMVEWAEPATGDSIPECDDPEMSELYEIPETCAEFPKLVQQHCGVDPEDVMVVRLFYHTLMTWTRDICIT